MTNGATRPPWHGCPDEPVPRRSGQTGAAARAWLGAAVAPTGSDGAPPVGAASDLSDGPADAALRSMMDAMVRSGGWDGRVAPAEAWRRRWDQVPFPSHAQWAQLPTFGPLDALLDDPQVTDVHLNGPGIETMIRRQGDVTEIGIGETWHRAWFPWIAWQCLLRSGGTAAPPAARLPAAEGTADAALPPSAEGTADATRPGRPPCRVRYVLVAPPLCGHGPSLTLRVLRPGALTLAALVERGMLSRPAAELLAGCVRANIDVYIVGLPGVGKTTLAQALIGTLVDQRLIVVEDVAELVVPPQRAVRLTTGSDGGHDHRAILRLALRMNPQRLVVGEVRGAEAYAVLAAASNGFPVLTTIHGDHALHGMQTFAVKAAQAEDARGGVETVYAMINARPSIVVGIAMRGGQRTVDEIVEIQRQYGAQRPIGEALFARTEHGLRLLAYPSPATRARLEDAHAWPDLETEDAPRTEVARRTR